MVSFLLVNEPWLPEELPIGNAMKATFAWGKNEESWSTTPEDDDDEKKRNDYYYKLNIDRPGKE